MSHRALPSAWSTVVIPIVITLGWTFATCSAQQAVQVVPAKIVLEGPESSLQVIVDGTDANGQFDWTSQTQFEVIDETIAIVSPSGLVEPRSQGSTELVANVNDQSYRVPIVVQQFDEPRSISFYHDVNPVLTKAGCNSGGCHGKAEGKNGFRLSLFGFDAEADYLALTMQARGRRINLASPSESLLLSKGSGRIGHGGGQAILPHSFGYRRILRWIQEGATLDRESTTTIESIRVTPDSRAMLMLRGESMLNQQLRVMAFDNQGKSHDITAECAYETNAPNIAEVTPAGLVQASGIPGEAAILVRYMGNVAVCRIRVPGQGSTFERPEENNFVDTLVWNKLLEMGIPPSDVCDDATFVRRVYLDVIGTLPTATAVREFLDDSDPRKRDKLIRQLLDRSEYASYWALRWADIMRVDANTLGADRSIALSRWLKSQFQQNRPYDEMVRDIVTARGDMQQVAPTAMYASLKTPLEAATAVSQLFLGVRIECAQCHHHPFERWSQQDFYALAGYFTGITEKKLPNGGSAVTLVAANDLKHPRTGEIVPAAGLGDAGASELANESPAPSKFFEFEDRRSELADWMTNSDNPFFARTIANRIWAHYFGRGLVEPIDDMRGSNPATNEPLLDALAEHLRQTNYDLKAFQRTILGSRVYQLSASTNQYNRSDEQYFSHAVSRSLPAEVLLDAICQVTGHQEKFNGWPLGARAIDVWDNRMPSYFFRIFGRPQRTTVCACERGDAPSITQALHLMNSPEIAAKISFPEGTAARLSRLDLATDKLIEEIYLTMLSRRPTSAEQKLFTPVLDVDHLDRFAAIEDVMWALMNSKEFLYNH